LFCLLRHPPIIALIGVRRQALLTERLPIDRHGGFINKFLGDGFLAIFGAPLDDPAASSQRG